MQDPFNRTNRPRSSRKLLLRVDSWIDSTLWAAWIRLTVFWQSLTIFFQRFRTRGFSRAVSELLGEAMTLGTAGSVLMLLLALPAFEQTHGNWMEQDDFAVTFLDRYGNEVGRRGIIHEDSVPVNDLPDHVINAVLATEDRRFFDHFGIDFLGLVRAMTENVKANSVVQGGSTISQQLAKNLFLTNERTLTRKVNEAYLALWLEANLTKKEILGLYLDRVYMGGGTFGIAAASRFYFGKDVTEVSLAEAAMLAGLFKAPARYAPHINLPAARARANVVLTNMVQGRFMTEGQVIGARRNPANVVDRGAADSPDYFLDWAFEEVKKIAASYPQHSLIVRTTFDPELQRAAEEALESGLRLYGKRYRVNQGAIVTIENGGAVRAMVGGRDYGESQFNRAAHALRQPGSSFKAYVYSTAMESGFTPESTINDGPITWNGWSPRNYGRGYSGRTTITRALVKSINTVPVRLARDHLGTVAIAETARNMGVETPIRTDKTMPLGTSEVTVLDQATAYAVFPAGGMSSGRHGISQILSYSGDVLYDHRRSAPPPQRVLSVEAATAMNSILTQIPEWGTGRRAKLDNIKTGGKTGTTQSYRDGWFVGFTGNFTTAVWFGNDDFTSTNRMTGGSLPAMTFKQLMTFAHQGIELRPIPYIGDPLPTEADAEKLAAAGDGDGELTDGDGKAQFLTGEATDILRNLAEKFKSAQPLEAEPQQSAGLVGQ